MFFPPPAFSFFAREIVESKPARRNAKKSFCNNLIYLFFVEVQQSSSSRSPSFLSLSPPLSISASPAQPSPAKLASSDESGLYDHKPGISES